MATTLSHTRATADISLIPDFYDIAQRLRAPARGAAARPARDRLSAASDQPLLATLAGAGVSRRDHRTGTSFRPCEPEPT